MATKTSHRRAHHRAMRKMEARRSNVVQVCPRCAHGVGSFEHFSCCGLGVQVPAQLRGSRR